LQRSGRAPTTGRRLRANALRPGQLYGSVRWRIDFQGPAARRARSTPLALTSSGPCGDHFVAARARGTSRGKSLYVHLHLHDRPGARREPQRYVVGNDTVLAVRAAKRSGYAAPSPTRRRAPAWPGARLNQRGVAHDGRAGPCRGRPPQSGLRETSSPHELVAPGQGRPDAAHDLGQHQLEQGHLQLRLRNGDAMASPLTAARALGVTLQEIQRHDGPWLWAPASRQPRVQRPRALQHQARSATKSGEAPRRKPRRPRTARGPGSRRTSAAKPGGRHARPTCGSSRCGR